MRVCGYAATGKDRLILWQIKTQHMQPSFLLDAVNPFVFFGGIAILVIIAIAAVVLLVWLFFKLKDRNKN